MNLKIIQRWKKEHVAAVIAGFVSVCLLVIVFIYLGLRGSQKVKRVTTGSTKEASSAVKTSEKKEDDGPGGSGEANRPLSNTFVPRKTSGNTPQESSTEADTPENTIGSKGRKNSDSVVLKTQRDSSKPSITPTEPSNSGQSGKTGSVGSEEGGKSGSTVTPRNPPPGPTNKNEDRKKDGNIDNGSGSGKQNASGDGKPNGSGDGKKKGPEGGNNEDKKPEKGPNEDTSDSESGKKDAPGIAGNEGEEDPGDNANDDSSEEYQNARHETMWQVEEQVTPLIVTVVDDPSGMAKWEDILANAKKYKVKIEGKYNRVLDSTKTFRKEASEQALGNIVSKAANHSSLKPLIDEYKNMVKGTQFDVFSDSEIEDKMIDAIALKGVSELSQLLKADPQLYVKTKRRVVQNLNEAISNIDSFRVHDNAKILDRLVEANGYQADADLDQKNGPSPSTTGPAHAAREWHETRKRYYEEKMTALADNYRKEIREHGINAQKEKMLARLAGSLGVNSNFFSYGNLSQAEVHDWSRTISKDDLSKGAITDCKGFKELLEFQRKLNSSFIGTDSDVAAFQIALSCDYLAGGGGVDEDSAELFALIAFNVRTNITTKENIIKYFNAIADPTRATTARTHSADVNEKNLTSLFNTGIWEDEYATIFVNMLRSIMREEQKGKEIVASVWYLKIDDRDARLERCKALSWMLQPENPRKTNIIELALDNLVKFMSTASGDRKAAVKAMGTELYAFYKANKGKKAFPELA